MPEDDWDFYLCRVDDAPASITLNLSLIQQLGTLPENTLYAVQVDMLLPGDHGMGEAREAEVMHRAEDALVEELVPLGFRHIAHLRNGGVWQITLMGPPGRGSEFEDIAKKHLSPLPQSFSTFGDSDPEWDYYSKFLFPKTERLRWIQDRRVVESLEQHGDPLAQARRVDHWLYFPDHDSQSAFASAVAQDGFEVVDRTADATDLGVQVHRVDSVRLRDIHEVTTLLTTLAGKFGGNYDGWETMVCGD